MGDVDRLRRTIRNAIAGVIDDPEEDDFSLGEVEMALQKTSQEYRELQSTTKQDEMDA